MLLILARALCVPLLPSRSAAWPCLNLQPDCSHAISLKLSSLNMTAAHASHTESTLMTPEGVCQVHMLSPFRSSCATACFQAVKPEDQTEPLRRTDRPQVCCVGLSELHYPLPPSSQAAENAAPKNEKLFRPLQPGRHSCRFCGGSAQSARGLGVNIPA